MSHWASRSAVLADIFSNLVRAHQSAHSALSGSSWADTPSYRNVLYPRGAVQLLETMAIALDRRLVRLCSLASFEEYKLRGRAVESYFVAIFEW